MNKSMRKVSLEPLEGKCGNLGELKGYWQNSDMAGSCSFCSNRPPKVLELQGGNLLVRLCQSCLKAVASYYEENKS